MKSPEWLRALAAFTPTERRMLAMLLGLALLGLATLVWHRRHTAKMEQAEPQTFQVQARGEHGR